MAKITEQEQEQIKKLQEDMTSVLFELGQIEADLYSINALNKETLNVKENTLSTLNKLKEQENNLVQLFKNKYGNVEIDLKTGEIK